MGCLETCSCKGCKQCKENVSYISYRKQSLTSYVLPHYYILNVAFRLDKIILNWTEIMIIPDVQLQESFVQIVFFIKWDLRHAFVNEFLKFSSMVILKR